MFLLQLGIKAGGDAVEQTRTLANKMGNLVILRKGEVDVISDGSQGIVIELHGCPVAGCIPVLYTYSAIASSPAFPFASNKNWGWSY